jgi:hypothetical protein
MIASRGKAALYLPACATFVWAGSTITPDTEFHRLVTWSASVFFGLGLPLFGWLVIRPQSLLLSSNGFTLGGGLIRSPGKFFGQTLTASSSTDCPEAPRRLAMIFARQPEAHCHPCRAAEGSE